MPLPLAPVALSALKYGTVLVAVVGVVRSVSRGRTDQRVEDALDDLDEGLAAHRPADRAPQMNAAARWRRVIRLGRSGPGVEVDAAALSRIRIRRV